MKHQFIVFIVRWMLNSLGIWVAVRLLGSTTYSEEQLLSGFWVFLLAGLIFSLINSVLRPLVIILSLPAILLTLGLFTIVVNGFMVYVSLLLSPGIDMTFVNSIIAGMILSLVNYIVSSVLELQYQRRVEKEQS